MNLLSFALLLVLATIHASPIPTHHSSSDPVSLSRAKKKDLAKGEDGDTNPAETGNIYNFHNSFIIKPEYPPLWYKKQAEKPKQKSPKKWDLDENEFLLAHSSWSPMFGQKIQSLIDSTSEKPSEKVEPQTPAENVSQATHPEAPSSTTVKPTEAAKEIQTQLPAKQPQRNTEQQNLGLGNFYGANIPHSSQNLNAPNNYYFEDIKSETPTSNGEYVYLNPHSHTDAYPAFPIGGQSLSEVHFPSNQNHFNGHSQGGQRTKESNQPNEEEGEYQIFLTKENVIESFPNYQGAVSYSYNSIADGQHQSVGQGGDHHFYSAPTFTGGQYSNQGKSSAHQHFQHYEQIPQIQDYSYQFGVFPISTSVGDIEVYNQGQNRYLPPVKKAEAVPSKAEVEGKDSGKDAVVNSEVSKEEVPYQIQISHNTPVQVDVPQSEHLENMEVKVDNNEEVTEVVIVKSVSSENLDAQGTIEEVQKEAEKNENVLVIEGNEMTDAAMEVAEILQNSEAVEEEQTTPGTSEVHEASTMAAEHDTTTAPSSQAAPGEGSVKEIHKSEEPAVSLEEGVAASNNPRPDENDLNKVHGVNALSSTHERDYSAPVKYRYKYAVEDKATGDIKSHEEERDGDLTKGKYSVHDADGLVRTVDYVVDGPSGFKASVMRKAKEMQMLREERIVKRLLLRN